MNPDPEEGIAPHATSALAIAVAAFCISIVALSLAVAAILIVGATVHP